MEGVDAYAFHQEMNHPKNRILETISSWLDLDLPNTPSFPQELQDLQMLDEHFFQFATTQIDSEPLPNLPRPDSPFILDLHEFDDNPPPPPPNNSTTEQSTINGDQNCYHPTVPVVQEDECEMYLNVMAESPESIGGVDQFFVQSDPHDQNFNIMSNSSSSSALDKVNKKQKKQKQSQQMKPQSSVHQNDTTTTTTTTNVDDDDEDEDQEIEEEPKRGTLNCKNLVSERNRRKRLSQQLLALRALVPNITKMDKRSVLVDALSYLKNMQEETARIQKELKEQQHHQNQLQHHQHHPAGGFMNETCLDDDSPGSNRTPRILATGGASKPKPQILEIDIEKIEDKRFIVKITCKGANGIGGDVLRVIESLGFEITYAALDQIKPQHVLTTIFIRVKKQEKMTEQKLKDSIISSALRSGLTFLQRC